jgi:hypothetical protein
LIQPKNGKNKKAISSRKWQIEKKYLKQKKMEYKKNTKCKVKNSKQK